MCNDETVYNTRHRIVLGDSRRLGILGDESIELVVTSPPYWQLKDYGTEQQIGFADTYEEYINNLNSVWMECARVLRPGCRLCINIGDQFARSVIYGRYKVIPIRTEIIRFCETIGLDYMGAIIWQKVTTTNTTGGASIMGSFPYPRNGIIKLDYEFILTFKKPGKSDAESSEAKIASKLTTAEWNQYFAGHWNFPGEKSSRHLAAFPVELPYRLIRMFTFVGETVLDPFLGGGTTCEAAAKSGRNSVGYEINPEFKSLVAERLERQASLFGEVDVDFSEDEPVRSKDVNYDHLPYLFQDPVRLNSLVDPRKMFFGSRVCAEHGREKDRFYAVKKWKTPVDFLTAEGLWVRLIGLRVKRNFMEQGISLAMEITAGNKITLVFDKNCAPSGEPVLAYVYLKNRTFVNRKLIESGFYEVDDTLNFSKRDVFLSIFRKLHLNAS